MARWPSWGVPTAAGVTLLLLVALSSHSELRLPPNAAITTVSITVDLDQGGHPVSAMLYGIFFEEVSRNTVSRDAPASDRASNPSDACCIIRSAVSPNLVVLTRHGSRLFRLCGHAFCGQIRFELVCSFGSTCPLVQINDVPVPTSLLAS